MEIELQMDKNGEKKSNNNLNNKIEKKSDNNYSADDQLKNINHNVQNDIVSNGKMLILIHY